MARVAINTGASANDGTGDNLRAAGGILNNNFLELYTYLGAGSTTVLSAPLWSSTNAGINTLSKVGIGTTNPRFALEVGAVGASGTTLFVNGDARVTGIVTIGPASITLNGITNIINVGTGITINGSTGIISATAIVLGGTTLTGAAVTFITAGSGISVNQGTGNVTITATGGGSSQWVTTAAGIHTLSNVGIGTTNPTSALTVTGNVLVSGVSTLTSNVSVGGTISINGGVKLETNNATIVGTSGSTGEIKRIAGAPFFYDGSAWREFVLSSGTPVTVPADTEWNNVAFRATFDTNFTDAKFGANPVYVSAGSTIVGAAVTIGTGAFRNDGAVGSGISYAYRSEYDFTGSWTIEFWMYVDSNPDVYFPESLVSMHSVTGIGTSGNWALTMSDDIYDRHIVR